jgi:hypothetical protein
LFADFREKFAIVIEDETPRIDHLKLAIAPKGLLISAIAGNPRFIMDNGFLTTS